MSYSFDSLQSFVMNLLSDTTAQAAYAADPLGALSAAGLGDLTPEDVTQAIPLITDALPVDLPLGDLDVDLTGIGDGADTLGGSILGTTDLASVGGLANIDSDGIDAFGGVASTVNGITGALHAEGSFAEASLTTPVAYLGADTHGDYLITTSAPSDVVGDLTDTTDAVTTTAVSAVSSGAETLATHVELGADMLSSALAVTPLADTVGTGGSELAGVVETGAETVTDALGNLPSLSDVTASLPLPDQALTPDLTGNLTNAQLGDVTSVASGLTASLAGALPVPELSDLAGNLPVSLPGVSDLGGVTDSLPVSLPAVPDLGSVTDVVSGVTSHLPVSLPAVPDLGSVTDTVTGVASNVPGASALPDLSTVTDTVGDVTNTVTHVTGTVSQVVTGVTSHLPVDTSAVTDVLSHNPVTDGVSSSPVGGVTDTVAGVADHLPVVSDLTDNLHLGL